MARLTNSNRPNSEVICDEVIANKSILLHFFLNQMFFTSFPYQVLVLKFFIIFSIVLLSDLSRPLTWLQLDGKQTQSLSYLIKE